MRVLQTYCNHSLAEKRLRTLLVQAHTSQRPVADPPKPVLKMRILSEEEIVRAIVLYEQGQTLQAIGGPLGVHADTVRKHLVKHGVKLRNPRDLVNHRLDEVIELYAEGQPLERIGRTVGVSGKTVGVVLRSAGIELRPNVTGRRAGS